MLRRWWRGGGCASASERAVLPQCLESLDPQLAQQSDCCSSRCSCVDLTRQCAVSSRGLHPYPTPRVALLVSYRVLYPAQNPPGATVTLDRMFCPLMRFECCCAPVHFARNRLTPTCSRSRASTTLHPQISTSARRCSTCTVPRQKRMTLSCVPSGGRLHALMEQAALSVPSSHPTCHPPQSALHAA